MSSIDDSRRLWSLTIPGSHDSAARLDGTYGGQTVEDTAKTQSLSIRDQLDNGTRFLDIRLVLENDTLQAYHGIVKQNITFGEIIDQVDDFLAENSSEVVIVSVKQEGNNSGANSLSFDDAVAAQGAASSNRWLVDSVDPTVGVARGKILLVRRYQTSNEQLGGLDLSYGWADNATFEIVSGDVTVRIQDKYLVQDPDTSDGLSANDLKWSAVLELLNAASTPPTPSSIFINFASGYQGRSYYGMTIPTIRTVSDDINVRLASFAQQAPSNGLGVVVVDFIDNSINGDLVSLNFP